MRRSPGNATPAGVRNAFARRVLWPSAALAGILLAVLMGDGAGGPAAAQTGGRPGSKVRSDRLVERKVGDRKIRYLYGNVFIDRDTLTAAADTAEEYVDKDIFLLTGNVKLTSEGSVLHCRWARYDRRHGSADFQGNVRLIDGDMTGTSLRGEVRSDGRYLRLMDQAVMKTPEHVVTADTIFQDRRSGLSMALGSVTITGRARGRAAADTAGTGPDSLSAPADSAAAAGRTAAPDTTNPQVLTCARAVFYRDGEESDFFGGVRLVDGEMIGTSSRAESRRNGDLFKLIGDALLVSPDYTIRADTIAQDQVTGLGEASGHVRIVEPGARNMVTGEHAIFDEEAGTAEVDRAPVLTSREQSGGPLTSRSGWMRFFRDEDRVVMSDSVRIHQDRTRAAADSAVAYGKERMVLMGEPEVRIGETNRLTGRVIEFDYDQSGLRRVHLMGQALMEDSSPDSLARIYEGLPPLDVLKGDTITVEFEAGEIRRTVVVGGASSHYTPTDMRDEVATNDVSGDTIVIHFRNEKVRRVEVFGNVEGVYKFAKLTRMKEMLQRRARRDSLRAVILESGEALPDSLALPAASAVGDSLAAADTLGVRPTLLPTLSPTGIGAVIPDSLLSALDLSDPGLAAAADSLVRALGLGDRILELVGGDLPADAAGRDSLLGAYVDSLLAPGSAAGKAMMDFLASAEKVDYSGDQVTFELVDETMEIQGNGKLIYGTMEHTAQHILLNTDTRELYSEGDPFLEDDSAVVGELMGYDFEHKTGAVHQGVTTFDGYYYVGDDIRRYPDETMKIDGGQMTSCDAGMPHYHFWSKNMKMRQGDKVVAAPIVLKIGHVPVFALPFYFKSLKEGRQSGILFPSFDFGWSSREGRYIRDFGYYWATNDYTDFIFEGDFNERQDFAYRLSNRYNKRYTFSGTVDYSKQISLREGEDRREWQLAWNHNQPNLMDDYKFRADVRMSSSSLSNNDLTSSTRRDIVSGQMKSNVYVSRNWDFLSANLSATRDGRVNAEDDDPSTDNLMYSLTLPSLSLSFRQFALAKPLRGGQRGSMLGDLMRNTYVQHSYTLKSDRKAYELTDVTRHNASGKVSVSVRPPRVGIFNVSLSANAGQDWYRETTEGTEWVDDTDSTGHFDPVYERTEDRRPSLSLSSNLGTTLYGLFPMRIGKLRAIRHTTKFNAGWNVTPAIRGKQDYATSVALSWNNRIDVKYRADGSDSTGTDKKLDGLIDWGLSTNYNPKKDPGQRWGDISSNLTFKPGQSRYLQLKVSNSIDPKKLALKSTRFNYNLSFQGRLDTGFDQTQEEAVKSSILERLGDDPAKKDKAKKPDPDDPFRNQKDSAFSDFTSQQNRQQQGTGPVRDDTENGRYIPFTVNASISYSYTNATGDKRANANFAATANLSRAWSIRYDTGFDLAVGSPVRQQFSLTRDLHCWAMEFNRTVSAVDSQFGFRLYLKSIPALKLTRGREDNFGGMAGGFGPGF